MYRSFPAWSADSKTVFFSDRAGSGVTRITLNAVAVSNGRTRRLATVTGLNHGEQLRTAPDPSIVYASIAGWQSAGVVAHGIASRPATGLIAVDCQCGLQVATSEGGTQ